MGRINHSRERYEKIVDAAVASELTAVQLRIAGCEEAALLADFLAAGLTVVARQWFRGQPPRF